MGLDQYGIACNSKTKKVEEFAYWRKHNALQGWMENLWLERGGEGEFNYIPLKLTLEDLNKLESDVVNDRLPATSGFFFGPDSRDDEHMKEKTIEFINRAKEYIDEGWEIEYNSDW